MAVVVSDGLQMHKEELGWLRTRELLAGTTGTCRTLIVFYQSFLCVSEQDWIGWWLS